jgi:hypothetical protein
METETPVKMSLAELEALRAQWMMENVDFVEKIIKVCEVYGERRNKSNVLVVKTGNVQIDYEIRTGDWYEDANAFNEMRSWVITLKDGTPVCQWGKCLYSAYPHAATAFIVPGKWQEPIETLYITALEVEKAQKQSEEDKKAEELAKKLLIGRSV